MSDLLDRLKAAGVATSDGTFAIATRQTIVDSIAEIERLRAQHRHCEHCGGSWLDDGINSGCYCLEIGRLQAALASVIEAAYHKNERLHADIEALKQTLAGVKSMFADELEKTQRLESTLARIAAVEGCECDSYEGHKCVLCRVRAMARGDQHDDLICADWEE
jgi:hypothetical protein